jgi:hypothetical protein
LSFDAGQLFNDFSLLFLPQVLGVSVECFLLLDLLGFLTDFLLVLVKVYLRLLCHTSIRMNMESPLIRHKLRLHYVTLLWLLAHGESRILLGSAIEERPL